MDFLCNNTRVSKLLCFYFFLLFFLYHESLVVLRFFHPLMFSFYFSSLRFFNRFLTICSLFGLKVMTVAFLHRIGMLGCIVLFFPQVQEKHLFPDFQENFHVHLRAVVFYFIINTLKRVFYTQINYFHLLLPFSFPFLIVFFSHKAQILHQISQNHQRDIYHVM